jgi:hypothetical protein
MKPEVRTQLIEYFKHDVEELSKITRRDLNKWLK